MSYLGSLLASYGAGQEQTPGKSTSAAASPSLTSASRAPNHIVPEITSGVKRKADEMVRNEPVKPAKTEADPSTRISRGNYFLPPRNEAKSQIQEGKAKVDSSTKAQSASDQRSLQKPRPAPTPAPAAAPPSKGSFAEIMARAKALQATKLGQGPTLKHKAVAQEDPREKRRRENANKDTKGASSARHSSRSGSEDPRKQRSSAKGVKSSKDAQKIIPSKPKREPIQVNYKGTMRPTAGQSSYRGTAAAQSSQNRIIAGRDGYERRGRRYEDDEEDEVENDYGDDYDSAASSDMEAGAWDIDEEEEVALRNAKVEDAAAKREEDEHRRQKLLRKQDLESGSGRRRF